MVWGWGGCETLSSGHGTAIVLMTSQHPWSPAHDWTLQPSSKMGVGFARHP